MARQNEGESDSGWVPGWVDGLMAGLGGGMEIGG